jgi:hypothetical protein
MAAMQTRRNGLGRAIAPVFPRGGVRPFNATLTPRWGLGLATGLTLALAVMAPRAVAQVAANPPMFTDLRLSPRFIPDPTRLRGMSGGEVPTEQLAGRLQTETGTCLGFVSEKPDHNLELTRFFDYLNVQVLSAGDTVMLIKGPGGTWCSDNRSIAGATVAGQWLPGRYRIWVGSAAANNYAPYSIEITEVR